MSDTPVAKLDALNRIAAIAAEHQLDPDEITAYLIRSERKEKSGMLLGRILGYLGGAFIFGGLALFIGMRWETFGSAERVIITYGAGLFAFILGLVTLGDARYKNASTPLFLSGAALQPTGMFVFLREYTDGGDAALAALTVFSLMAFQYMAAFSKHRRTSLLFCGYLFYNTALAILLDRAGMPDRWIGVVMGVSMLAIAAGLDKGAHRAMASLWYVVGSLALLASAYDLLENTPLDIGLLVLSIYLVFFSVQVRSRALLLVNTLGLFSFLGYYTHEYFSNVVGWPLALILLGFMMVGVSAGAIRLDRRIKSGRNV